jgi:tetratricopeptide (TPR) repeat protein
MMQAAELSPGEPHFQDELANSYSDLAVGLMKENDATTASQVATVAVSSAQHAIKMSPSNLTFYKTYARVLLNLAAYQPQLLPEAQKVLEAAHQLAPTEPKILYNLALLNLTLDPATGLHQLEETVQLKPNYEAARMSLASAYLSASDSAKAAEQYRYVLEKIQPNNLDAQAGLERIATASASRSQTTPSSKPKKP